MFCVLVLVLTWQHKAGALRPADNHEQDATPGATAKQRSTLHTEDNLLALTVHASAKLEHNVSERRLSGLAEVARDIARLAPKPKKSHWGSFDEADSAEHEAVAARNVGGVDAVVLSPSEHSKQSVPQQSASSLPQDIKPSNVQHKEALAKKSDSEPVADQSIHKQAPPDGTDKHPGNHSSLKSAATGSAGSSALVPPASSSSVKSAVLDSVQNHSSDNGSIKPSVQDSAQKHGEKEPAKNTTHKPLTSDPSSKLARLDSTQKADGANTKSTVLDTTQNRSTRSSSVKLEAAHSTEKQPTNAPKSSNSTGKNLASSSGSSSGKEHAAETDGKAQVDVSPATNPDRDDVFAKATVRNDHKVEARDANDVTEDVNPKSNNHHGQAVPKDEQIDNPRPLTSPFSPIDILLGVKADHPPYPTDGDPEVLSDLDHAIFDVQEVARIFSSLYKRICRFSESLVVRNWYIAGAVYALGMFLMLGLYSLFFRYRDMDADQDFHFGLLDCAGDVRICLYGLACAPIRWADTMQKGGLIPFFPAFLIMWFLLTLRIILFHFFSWGCLVWLNVTIVGVFFRQKVRRRCFLQESTPQTYIEDFFAWCCLPECAVCQEARQVEAVLQIQQDNF